MTAPTKRLAIGRIKRPLRYRPHRNDMIDLETPADAALTTFPAVALEDGHAQHLPAFGAGDAPRMPPVSIRPDHSALAEQVISRKRNRPCAASLMPVML